MRAAIFIDYENVRIRLNNLTIPVDADKIDFVEKLVEVIKTKTLSISHIFLYDNFENKYYANKNYLTKLTALGITPKHTLSTNTYKNSADIELCLDAYELCLKNDIDTFIIVSSDKDMFPLIKKLKADLRNVILVGITFNATNYIIKYVDEFIPIESIIGIPYDKDHIIKQDIIIATKRLKDLNDWVAKNTQPGLGKEFFIEKLKTALFSTGEYAQKIYAILLNNNIASEYQYTNQGNKVIGVKINLNDITNNILNDKIPNFS